MENDIFVCPVCHRSLTATPSGFNCIVCQRDYAMVDGVLDFFICETEEDAINRPNQTWLDPEIVEARNTVYRFCTRELRGMAFAMQQIGQRTFPGCRVLDAGMGTGHFTRWLAETCAPGTEIYAFDCSWPIISKARANVGEQSGVTLFRANSRDRLPFREEAFDLLFLRLAPLGGRDIPNVQAGYKLLKPGGWYFEAGWEPERFDTPWIDWALQHGFDSAEAHEWRYLRTRTWQEFAASQVERNRLASMGGRVKNGPGTDEESSETQHCMGEGVQTMTHEHLHVAHKPS